LVGECLSVSVLSCRLNGNLGIHCHCHALADQYLPGFGLVAKP
jgi:hypothetical protein